MLYDKNIEINNYNQQEQEQDTTERTFVPDISSLSSQLKCCLQESNEIPLDFTKLYNTDLFEFDTFKIPKAIELYNKLDLKHEILTIIPPSFEAPMPILKPATFPPNIQELPNPSLELFDLDEYFSTE